MSAPAAPPAPPAPSRLGDLTGRAALVTGAGRGIGRAIARQLIEAGAHVAILDVDAAAAEDAADAFGALAPAGGKLVALAADVADETAVADAVARARDALGGLDIVINNAARATAENPSPDHRIEHLDRAAWQRVLDVSLTGPMLMVKHALPHLRARRGAVVNIASTRALQSEPHTEAYVATKGGLVALTHALAISLGPEVRVNCISPGWIDTSAWQPRGQERQAKLRPEDHAQHPVGRVGQPEDVAALCLYLISDAAGFVTGQNFVIDGGMTRKMIYEP
ncbi:MAG TPA: glucose 1-dehydrogenase [Haliangium sp.]|nr:glucose 1-dehydrogenase [Haliangium sp.]